MAYNQNYQILIKRLKESAKDLANQIGFTSFDVDLAEEDFIDYLNSASINDVYPLFGGCSSLVDYVNKMDCYSGTGNPFSPVIYAGSELASNLQDDKSLYFKISADLQWKEIFDIPSKCPFILEHIKRKFIEKWDGANEHVHNSYNLIFYTTLRETLNNDQQFVYDYPFVVYQTLYHTKRKGGHEWNIANKFLSILTGYQEYYEPKKIGESFHVPSPADRFIDELIFMTECNLKPAATGEQNGFQLNQFVFSQLLDNFKQKRIVILHPKGSKKGNSLKSTVEEKINSKARKIAILKSIDSFIEVYSYNGHKIIISPRNLSMNVKNELLCDLSYAVKKKSLREL